jgi:CBS domain containing-hemolysin-like protein
VDLSATVVTWLAIFAGVGILAAAVMHAVVAAFEQLPHARERELAQAVRPDGKPSTAARLAQAPHYTENAASVIYATAEPLAMVCWSFLALEIGLALGWDLWVIAVVAAVVAGFISLMLIRALPRQLARAYPEATVRAVAPVAWTLVTLTSPLRRVVPALQMPELSEAEDLVERAQDALEDEDAQLLRGVVTLGDTFTREVMVPRTDMVTLQAGTSVRKAMLLFMRSGYSRVPVIGEGTDDVRGVLYLKDAVRATWDHPEALDEPIDTHLREPVFIPESVPADDLLRRMQDEVFHMAIVVDEYGGVAGLVTIEDALEEIVGEVVDEHDQSAPEPEELGDGSFRVPARMPLDELGELFDIEIDDDDVETVAGLLSKALGRVPIPGASAQAHGLVLTAERASGRRRRLTWVIAAPVPADEPEVKDQPRSRRRKGVESD